MVGTESIVEGRATPSPEVLEKPVRRRFTVQYKVKILAEADACTETGQLGECSGRHATILRQGEGRRRPVEHGCLHDRHRVG